MNHHHARHASHRIAALDLEAPDLATTLADCRTALGITRGLHLDDICPTTGYDLSADGYRTARDDWWRLIERGSLPPATLAAYRRVRARWQESRPDLAHDWPDLPEQPA